MKQFFKKILLPTLLLCFHLISLAQNRKFEKNIALSKDSNNFQKIINQFKGKPISFIDSTSFAINKFIKEVANFEGKIIQTIRIEQKHFGYNINNPTNPNSDALTKFADDLHNKTNEHTIRKNLFIQEQEKLNPLIIAYNEKWLRDLPYIQDARILAFANLVDSNQVDLLIVTKDIFPFGGSINIKNANAYYANFSTENINDKGNSYDLSHNFDSRRETKMGWGFDFIRRNIKGSFMDVAIGAKSFASNYSNGALSANQIYIKGNRPLLTPLSKWTWGFEWNKSNNKNVYASLWSDSLYQSSIQYKNENIDTWLGYQIDRTMQSLGKNPARHFIQFRYFENHFTERPLDFLFQMDKNYLNQKAFLSSYTLFKQAIIRTRYLYGFGRNEDLPTGNSMVVTIGHYKKEQMAQPYFGMQLENYILRPNENFRHAKFSMGFSYLDKQIQDFRFLASLEKISKLHYLESGYKYRSIINISVGQTLRNKFNEALLINSFYGIPQLNNERIHGGTRISANWESIWYNSRSFFGFRTSPFAFGNLTYIRSVGEIIEKGDLYSSVGTGIRIRNENLIFGTIELKGLYFPRTHLQGSPWNISLVTNLRYKYNSNIISKPDFVQIN